MHSDDEDFEGSGMDNLGDAVTVSEGSSRQVTIPIQCHQEPLFPTVSGFNQVDDDNVMVSRHHQPPSFSIVSPTIFSDAQ